jgi:hypothetical protein
MRRIPTAVVCCSIFPALLLCLPGCNDSGNAGTPESNLGTADRQNPDVPGVVVDKSTLDATSDGGTITFQNIGSAGWYPSRRDPAVGPCDAYSNGNCCMGKHVITSDSLTPWNEDLIMTLRGPMIVAKIAAYQPDSINVNSWNRVSMWDVASPTVMNGIAFKGNNTETAGFQGIVGNTCLVDVSTNKRFATGTGSMPYCPPTSDTKYWGWVGSKMIILQATMPRLSVSGIPSASNCGNDPTNNWYDAPWIGLSHGEMVRSGAFGSCQCYAKDPAQWWLADGCGQFNVFEVVNDNNDYQNFDLFSTNFFGYGGYVGEGPCGKNCKVSTLDSKVDLINKSTSLEAATGATASPTKGPGAAFRRPETGYRFFVILLDVKTRQVQLALIHPSNVPATVTALLPGLPSQVTRATIDAVLALRLPGPNASVINK